LLLADRERADDRLRRNVETDHAEILARLVIDRGSVDQSEAVRLAAQEDVGTDREVVCKVKLLMY
jgi:hypothetical protein